MQKMQATLQNGTVIQDRYTIVDILGRGGFSAVYLVKDEKDGLLFALKELIDQDKVERTRFTFECTVLERLQHPALPRVHRVFAENNRAYMLMDYVEGSNLEVLRRKQSHDSFSLREVLTIMEPIVQALSYLHCQEPPIIHRDIKPSNIIVLQEDGAAPGQGNKKAVLVDFGIAKEYTSDSTTTAIRHCSPGYGAPEQYALGTDLRTDIYGLAATFYALLTGSVPVDALQRATQLGTKGIDPLVPVRSLAADVPEHVAHAIERALSIAPDHRFNSVDEFWQAMNGQPERVVNTGAIAVWPVLTSLRKKKSPTSPIRRWSFFVQIVLALLLILTVILGIKAYMANAQPAHPAPSKLSATTTHMTRTTLPTPSPSGVYPTIAYTYAGKIDDLLSNVSTSMTITQVQQNGAIFKGSFTGLSETAPFNGVLDTSSHIFFTVVASDGHPSIFFQGNVRSEGDLVGNFCDVNSAGACINDYGLWSVVPKK